jgi:hypothetical protein
VIAVLVVVVYGGYGQHWSWTGINGQTATLWDWLHLLRLPIAAVLLPLWLRHRPTMGSVMKGVSAGLGVLFVVLVIAGYTVPWAWTGFAGNTLWDWLHLLLLPLLVPVVLVPILQPVVMARMGIVEEAGADPADAADQAAVAPNGAVE